LYSKRIQRILKASQRIRELLTDTMNAKTKAKPKTVMLTARVPAPLVKLLDKAAQNAKRSRSAEMELRMERSLAAEPVIGGGGQR
jgi:hypothetical protein